MFQLLVGALETCVLLFLFPLSRMRGLLSADDTPPSHFLSGLLVQVDILKTPTGVWRGRLVPALPLP